MKQSAVVIKSGDLTLEGVVGCPEEISGPLPGVVLCHPHPLNGGNMNNNVILSVYFALVESGYIALRFNFRGVGNSEGTHADGDKERHDAEAALNTLRERSDVDGNRLGMVGYSFGTGVISSGLPMYTDAKAFVLISSPLRYLEHPEIVEDRRPKLYVCGDRDHGIPIAALKEKVDSFGQTSKCHVVAGADHFWGDYESEAAVHTVRFLNDSLT